MKLTREANLGQGWEAHLFDTGELAVRNGKTGEITWLPKQSVDTLVNICQEIKAEQKEK